jgi:NDP-sugar pyrophosphorylase family protein
MIAVVVLPGPNADMHGLDREAPLALLPLGDRPLLQHIVEFLVLQGVRSFEFILEHAPEKVEQALGDGTRWGCQFRYHLVFQAHQPYRSLSVMQEIADGQAWLLVHADAFPFASFSDYSQRGKPVRFVAQESSLATPGTLIFPGGGDWVCKLEKLSLPELVAFLNSLSDDGSIEQISVQNWICGHTPSELLASQNTLLNRTFPELMVGGIENDPGIWVSRNVVVHPSVKMKAPLFLGANSRLGQGVEIGPNVVVSANCVIDAHSILRNSLIVAGSYVGEKLELDEVIVYRNLLVNARLGAAVTISDSFLLGEITAQSEGKGLSQLLDSVAALILFLVCLPFYVVILLVLLFKIGHVEALQAVRLPAPRDAARWRAFRFFSVRRPGQGRYPPAGWSSFLWHFVPGLLGVIGGNLHLVGLPLRTAQEIEALPIDWQALYLSGKAGLITEASVAETIPKDEIEIYLHETFYRATRSWWYDGKLFFRYLSRLVVGSAGGPALDESFEGVTPAETKPVKSARRDL